MIGGSKDNYFPLIQQEGILLAVEASRHVKVAT